MSLFETDYERWYKAKKEQEYKLVVANIEMLIEQAKQENAQRAQNSHELAKYLVNNGVYIIS